MKHRSARNHCNLKLYGDSSRTSFGYYVVAGGLLSWKEGSTDVAVALWRSARILVKATRMQRRKRCASRPSPRTMSISWLRMWSSLPAMPTSCVWMISRISRLKSSRRNWVCDCDPRHCGMGQRAPIRCETSLCPVLWIGEPRVLWHQWRTSSWMPLRFFFVSSLYTTEKTFFLSRAWTSPTTWMCIGGWIITHIYHIYHIINITHESNWGHHGHSISGV